MDALEKEDRPVEHRQKLAQFASNDHFYDNMVKITCASTGQYSVINHGDCWIPNFLLTYDGSAADGSVPVQTKLIDFQLARHASPALDISFFIYSGTSQELRTKHYDLLLEVGLRIFVKII